MPAGFALLIVECRHQICSATSRGDVMYRTVAAYGVAILAGVIAAILVMVLRDDHAAPQIVIAPIPPDAAIVVVVEGAVATPGVYQLPSGARLQDAVAIAGGLSSDADVEAINPVERLADGQQIVVPTMVIAAAAETGALAVAATRIDLNTASAPILETLPGIGPVIATAIVNDRTINGRFLDVDDLARVPGVSDQLVEELRSLVTVSE